MLLGHENRPKGAYRFLPDVTSQSTSDWLQVAQTCQIEVLKGITGVDGLHKNDFSSEKEMLLLSSVQTRGSDCNT